MNWQEMDDITIERKKKHKKKNRKRRRTIHSLNQCQRIYHLVLRISNKHLLQKDMYNTMPIWNPSTKVKEFGYEIEYSTDDSLYGLKALTVEEWIKFGRKLGEPVKDLKIMSIRGRKRRTMVKI